MVYHTTKFLYRGIPYRQVFYTVTALVASETLCHYSPIQTSKDIYLIVERKGKMNRLKNLSTAEERKRIQQTLLKKFFVVFSLSSLSFSRQGTHSGFLSNFLKTFFNSLRTLFFYVAVSGIFDISILYNRNVSHRLPHHFLNYSLWFCLGKGFFLHVAIIFLIIANVHVRRTSLG